ncbi:MAG: ATP-binding protein [Lachnospiraceae bacterium]|nr:ATP-binding protein [Lachnospiraceae bacterium]
MANLMLPIGIESFEEIRTDNFYYVDKTDMIRELMENRAKVNLFTRPRRFGKSLNMDMLKEFFEYGADSKLFDGLAISKETELCERYMGKYPVVSISFRGVEAETFDESCKMIAALIRREARRHDYLQSSNRLSTYDQEQLNYLLRSDIEMNEDVLCMWIQTLSELLRKHHGQKAVILIDEYDVPLAKASTKKYYEKMVSLIRRMFEQGLKTNPDMFFGVLTGCLRVSKESIFTGLNNPNIYSISDEMFSSSFGFTDEEVRQMLEFYGVEEYYGLTREWYDGYHFGNTNVFCPWDVINWVKILSRTSQRRPQNFWVNSSGNDVLRHLVEKTGTEVPKDELAVLMEGGVLWKRISEELTYSELYDSLENVWSLMYMTGYLTLAGEPEGNLYPLRIPNQEICSIFEEQVVDLFLKHAKTNTEKLDALCQALKTGNAADTEKEFNEYLSDLISIRDIASRKDRKENFYHGILLSLLGMRVSWSVRSNPESGLGYPDIVVRTQKDGNIGIVIEMEYAEKGDFKTACDRGMKQINDTKYTDVLRKEKIPKIYKFAIACYKKECQVVAEEEEV